MQRAIILMFLAYVVSINNNIAFIWEKLYNKILESFNTFVKKNSCHIFFFYIVYGRSQSSKRNKFWRTIYIIVCNSTSWWQLSWSVFIFNLYIKIYIYFNCILIEKIFLSATFTNFLYRICISILERVFSEPLSYCYCFNFSCAY